MTYKGISIMLTAGLSTKTLQARREWQDIFRVLKKKNATTKIILPDWAPPKQLYNKY